MVSDHSSVTDIVSELNDTHKKVWFWRIASATACTALLLMTVGFVSSLLVGIRLAEVAVSNRDMCITPDTAASLLATAERVSRVNDLCIEAHLVNEYTLIEALPGLVTRDRVSALGLSGGEHDRRHRKRVSALPKNERVGGLLPR